MLVICAYYAGIMLNLFAAYYAGIIGSSLVVTYMKDFEQTHVQTLHQSLNQLEIYKTIIILEQFTRC